MKKLYYFILAIVIAGGVGAIILTISQDKQQDTKIVVTKSPITSSQDEHPITGLLVKELSLTSWNTPDGLPYKKVPGANLGATSFEVLDQTRIAFLCNSTSEIIITDMSNGKSINKFPVLFAPNDFVYDNGFFYVLSEYQVTIYDNSGKEVNKFSFPNSFVGIERLARYNNATYLLHPSGNSIKIESAGRSIEPHEQEGWITNSGDFVFTRLNGDMSYYVKIITEERESYEKIYSTDKKVAGVFVIGSTKNRVVLDVQTYLSENPVAVERNIVSVELNKNGLGPIVTSIKVPDCYYVLSNKDFDLSESGNIFNMVTAPQGVFVFSLTEIKSEDVKGYPESLLTIKYHFNNYLIQIEEK